jgi:hypothetical protein
MSDYDNIVTSPKLYFLFIAKISIMIEVKYLFIIIFYWEIINKNRREI